MRRRALSWHRWRGQAQPRCQIPWKQAGLAVDGADVSEAPAVEAPVLPLEEMGALAHRGGDHLPRLVGGGPVIGLINLKKAITVNFGNG